jgi:hypothetical protein
MRTYIKRAVMFAYCHGWLPAWAVRLAFFAFRLRAQ